MPFNAIQRVKRATATLCHLFAAFLQFVKNSCYICGDIL